MWWTFIENIIMNICVVLVALLLFALILGFAFICNVMTDTNALIFSGIVFVILLVIISWIECQ